MAATMAMAGAASASATELATATVSATVTVPAATPSFASINSCQFIYKSSAIKANSSSSALLSSLKNKITKASFRFGKSNRDKQRLQIITEIDQFLKQESTTSSEMRELAWYVLSKRRQILSLRNSDIDFKIAMAYFDKLAQWDFYSDPQYVDDNMQPRSLVGLHDWVQLLRESGLHNHPRFLARFTVLQFPKFIDSIEFVLRRAITNGERFRFDDENLVVIIRMLKVHMDSLTESIYGNKRPSAQDALLKAHQLTDKLSPLISIDELRHHLYFQTLIYDQIRFLKEGIKYLPFKVASQVAVLINQLETDLKRP